MLTSRAYRNNPTTMPTVEVLSQPAPDALGRTSGKYIELLQEPRGDRCVVVANLSEADTLKQAGFRRGWRLRRRKQADGTYHVWRVE